MSLGGLKRYQQGSTGACKQRPRYLKAKSHDAGQRLFKQCMNAVEIGHIHDVAALKFLNYSQVCISARSPQFGQPVCVLFHPFTRQTRRTAVACIC